MAKATQTKATKTTKPAKAGKPAAAKTAKAAKKVSTEMRQVGGMTAKTKLTKATVKKVMSPYRLIERAVAQEMAYVENKKTTEVWGVNVNANGGQLVADLEGGVVLRVPDTWVPINLTNLVPKDALVRSVSFRDAIRDRPGRGRMIKIILPEIAHEILSRPEARTALADIDQRERERMESRSNRTQPRKETEEQQARAQARVVELLSRRERGTLLSKEFWRQIDAIKVTKEDLQYVALNARGEEDKKKARSRIKKL